MKLEHRRRNAYCLNVICLRFLHSFTLKHFKCKESLKFLVKMNVFVVVFNCCVYLSFAPQHGAGTKPFSFTVTCIKMIC